LVGKVAVDHQPFFIIQVKFKGLLTGSEKQKRKEYEW
jgi:hypothetical protein